MSNFIIIQKEWPAIFEDAVRAENMVFSDPRTACFYARRTLELAVQWAYKHDAALKLPYQDNLSALVYEPSFKQLTGEAIFNKARIIITLGNRAVHSHLTVPASDSLTAVRELFHVAYWFSFIYSRTQRPAIGLTFDENKVPSESPVPPKTIEQLKKMETELHQKDEKLSELLTNMAALDDELKRLRIEVTLAKQAAAAQTDTHDYSEADTRRYLIDMLLKEAGWPLDQPRDREFEVTGMPNTAGSGFVDYVLWGGDGKPLGLIEAKRTHRGALIGQQQAKLYADCLEKQFGRRPVIFCSNGYEHWIWDDSCYPPRQIQGFYTKSELELLIQRRTNRKKLAEAEIKSSIVERYYQTRAIRRVTESFEKDHERKALLVMATGSGKTRTVIGLCDLLIKCNWAKHILFLADRVALVNQAVNAFKKFLPDSSPVNLVTEKSTQGRVFVSTYPTMMGLIDETLDGERRFGAGYFDLVIIDEAHRSIFQKYRAIFNYFDSLLVGLTATPRDEIDRNTYNLFGLEAGVPTDAYSLDEAVRDGFLVPPGAISVQLKFQRDGIDYNALSEEEKDQWDMLDWNDEGQIPDRVESEAVNRWLFNSDTVDKVLENLMTRGQKVCGGDRLGKTIIFAKNQAHADFIAERFNENYPHYKGEFARVITFKTEYAQSLIDAFSIPDKMPQIAISVDMLDTGIDIPEVVNLVFFKMVRSKTKFWQMIGRGTRLRPDLFGPGEDKKVFYIFDYCQNIEYFNQNPETIDGSITESLSARLFNAQLEIIGELDKKNPPDEKNKELPVFIESDAPASESEVRALLAANLHKIVFTMNLDNFVVRPKRRLIEKYLEPSSWRVLDRDALSELSANIAGLPSEVTEFDDEESKRFDLLIYNTQLAILRIEPGLQRLTERVKEIAGLLEEQSGIPVINEKLELIQEIQTDSWWESVTVAMLELIRLRLRALVKLIEKKKRKIVYTNFEDEISQTAELDLLGRTADNFDKFKAKARAFLREHENHITIHKLRINASLNPTDLDELEKILQENGIGTANEIKRAKAEAHGLGIFVRSLIGLDRLAAKEALADFEKGKTLNASQIEFVNMIVNYLTEHGVMETAQLYEPPFTDKAPSGPEVLFNDAQIIQLQSILDSVKMNALAA